jgi:acetyltransferase-like isoleucine patch superfamily enzyme
MKDAVKAAARGAAFILVIPNLLSYGVRAAMLGRDRALEGSMHTLGLVPGVFGEYVRRAFLARVLDHCAPTAVIGYGTLISQAGCRIDDHVYVGPRCHLGLAHLEHDVLLAAGVHIPSGRHTHGTAGPGPMREQEGQRRMVRIGANSWIGSAAVVMADVGHDTVVGAGAVVTQPLPSGVVAAGVPARVVRHREQQAGSVSA